MGRHAYPGYFSIGALIWLKIVKMVLSTTSEYLDFLKSIQASKTFLDSTQCGAKTSINMTQTSSLTLSSIFTAMK
jgi:hypothetical protein